MSVPGLLGFPHLQPGESRVKLSLQQTLSVKCHGAPRNRSGWQPGGWKHELPSPPGQDAEAAACPSWALPEAVDFVSCTWASGLLNSLNEVPLKLILKDANNGVAGDLCVLNRSTCQSQETRHFDGMLPLLAYVPHPLNLGTA